MKKQLPTPDIPTQTYICTAALGIVINNSLNAYAWECLNCIKLRQGDDSTPGFSSKMTINDETKIPFIRRKFIQGYEYFDMISDPAALLDYFRNSLADGRYVYTYFDEIFVPGMEPYEQYSYEHDFILFSCDDDTREFGIMTYTKNKQFEKLQVNYDILVKSITEKYGGKSMIISAEAVNSDFELTIRDVYSTLLIYSNLNTNADCSMTLNMGVYDRLAEDIVCVGKGGFDYRTYRQIFEHKKCMQYLIERIAEMLPDEDFSAELEQIGNCVDETDIIFKLVIKYNITGSDSLKQKLLKRLSSVYKTESSMIDSLCTKLRPHLKGESCHA